MNHKIVKLKMNLVVLLMLVAGAGFTSCEKYTFSPPVVEPDVDVLFQTEIQPIFTANCINCHGGLFSPDLRDGKAYESLTTGGYVDLPAENSRLYLKITSSSHLAKTNDLQKQKILVWITQGAKNN
jgi:hypothetical protein